ncbi:hypothetical protein TNCT_191311 [Trichonephila clavata]|uniref:Uncharacterized protein n=1 Tax=Trichonephila clavata TaxID=2740835 RepID=A0A8X6FF46_TRICU|nr:hypothetical protein TNCT_191311 [Trichonephila clavata]
MLLLEKYPTYIYINSYEVLYLLKNLNTQSTKLQKMENHLTKLSPYGALYSLSSRLMVLDVDYEKCEPTSPKSLQEEVPPPEEQLSKNLVDYLGQRGG